MGPALLKNPGSATDSMAIHSRYSSWIATVTWLESIKGGAGSVHSRLMSGNKLHFPPLSVYCLGDAMSRRWPSASLYIMHVRAEVSVTSTSGSQPRVLHTIRPTAPPPIAEFICSSPRNLSCYFGILCSSCSTKYKRNLRNTCLYYRSMSSTKPRVSCDSSTYAGIAKYENNSNTLNLM